MDIKGNKGEWSEIYTLLKLLGEGKVYAGDQNLNRIKSLFYPIVMILRHEAENSVNYRVEDRDIVIEDSAGNTLLCIPAQHFLTNAEHLLTAIRSGKGAFGVPTIEAFLDEIKCHSLKAKSRDKTDIHIVLHDRRTKINAEMGFSIKSQLGNPSTLLNASKATNFTFRVEGTHFSDEEIVSINRMDGKQKVIDRMQAITHRGGRFVFEKIDNATFNNNLTLLDSDLPRLIGHLLLEQSASGCNTIKELVNQLQVNNPMGYDLAQASPYYTYKIKHLLTSTALGMMPATAWDGRFEANGGYLVVKSDGEIVCYHFYDRNRFEDYLYAAAYLERASTSRHEFGQLYRDEQKQLCFKLNLQIRMK